MLKELESKQDGYMFFRIAKDRNGMFYHQYKSVHEDENPPYNDGWTTNYISSCVLSVHLPYPYRAPSNYYYLKKLGYSVEEALR